jgi:hypothetical protein
MSLLASLFGIVIGWTSGLNTYMIQIKKGMTGLHLCTFLLDMGCHSDEACEG